MTEAEARYAYLFGTDVTFTDESGRENTGVITHLMIHALGGEQVAEVVTRSGAVEYIDIKELSTS